MQAPQKVKVPYFADPLWNARSRKSSPQEARKLPQASRRRMKLFISVNLKEFCGVCRLLITTSFCSVHITVIHPVAAKGNHARPHIKSCLRKGWLSLLFLQSEHFSRSAFPKLDKECEAFV